MNRVEDFFLQEAGECLAALSVVGAPTRQTAEVLYDAARRLRGSAQMARFGGIADEAGRLEQHLRGIARGETEWDESVVAELVDATAAIAEAVADVRAGRIQQDARTETPMGQKKDEVAELPLEELEYTAQKALERALELRAALEDAVVAEQPSGPIIEELFDLIRLGMK